MSSSVFALQVSPNVPPALSRLADLAKNFWFSWHPTLGQLIRRLDPSLWRAVEGSPRMFLRCVDQSILIPSRRQHQITHAQIDGGCPRFTEIHPARHDLKDLRGREVSEIRVIAMKLCHCHLADCGHSPEKNGGTHAPASGHVLKPDLPVY